VRETAGLRTSLWEPKMLKESETIHGTSKLIIAQLLAADDIGYMPINSSHSKTRRGRFALK